MTQSLRRLGMVKSGLPNHLNTQRLGEDKNELYQFGMFRQAKTAQPSFGGGYVLLAFEDSVCSPLHPSPFWALGVGDSALARKPKSDALWVLSE